MELTFKLTKEEVDVIGNALGEIPTKFGMPVFNKLSQQFNDQMAERTIERQVEEVEE